MDSMDAFITAAGAVLVAVVTVSPMWLSARRTRQETQAARLETQATRQENSDQHGGTAASIRRLEGTVVLQGMNTLLAIQNLEKKFDDHINDRTVHTG
jgi:hypothetical protein